MRMVVRSDNDMAVLQRHMATIPDEGWLVEFSKHKRPRTLSQCRKIHAMMNDLGDFCGDPDMKGFIKQLAFWPTEIVTAMDVQVERPKSEALLSLDEESEIIEHLYQVGAELPGFAWGDL